MRVLVVASLVLAAIPFLPSAAAEGCIAEIAGICIYDPRGDPCGSVVSCRACFATVDVCAHLDRCAAGDLRGCVDYVGACTCDPVD